MKKTNKKWKSTKEFAIMKVESRNFKYEEYKKNETDSLRNWENLTGYFRVNWNG